MSPHRIVLSASLILLCCFTATAEESAGKAILEYPVSAEFMVLELTSRGGATFDPQEGPFLRIYGDGRVHVRLPPYVRLDPGDHEAFLSHADLQTLLSIFSRKGLMSFDRQALDQQREEVERARLKAGQGVPVISDAAYTILTIRLANYAPAGSDVVTKDFQKTLDWYALSEAESYPELQILVRFQEFVDVLSSIRSKTIEASKRGETSIWLPAPSEKD